MIYEVWIEGHSDNGGIQGAQPIQDPETGLITWEGKTFKDACKNALEKAGWLKDQEHLYDPEKNTFWSCRFFDNEGEARKSFG